MANSILCFEGKYVRLPDKDLAIIFTLYLNAVDFLIRQGSSKFKPISDVVHQWIEGINNSCPGTIDMDFDDFISSQEIKNQMIEVFDELISQLESFGENIPKNILKNVCPKRMQIFQSDTKSILKDVDQLVAMIA